MKRLEAAVYGRVQGVFYRQATRELARHLGLVGWVRNERDGSVRLVAEGAEPDLRRLLAYLGQGPADARVDRVESRWSEAGGEFTAFNVTYP